MKVINSLLKTLGCVVLPVGVTFFDRVGYIARVDGISMQPSLNPLRGETDYVFLNTWSIWRYDVSRGDIIALISPKDPDQIIIKRVIGLEGDVVSTSGYRSSFVRVPQGHCWVEGDHKGHSLDSNSFGPVALGLAKAKATYIIWPPSRWQSLKTKLQHEPSSLVNSAGDSVFT